MDELATIENLKTGQPIEADLVDLRGMLLLRKGSRIESAEVMESLLARGARFRSESPSKPAAKGNFHLYVRKLEASPFEIVRYLQDDLRRLCMAEVEVASFAGTIRSMAVALIEAVDRDEDASLASIFLNSGDGYAVTHQIHTAIIAAVLTRAMGFTPLHQVSVVCAALTMNIAMLEYQEWLNESSFALTTDERAMIRKHCETGVEILRQAGVSDALWLRLVGQHHETQDGTGYPEGLDGLGIEPGAQILQIADLYTARVSKRGWCDRTEANSALVEMLKDVTGNKLPRDLTMQLIRIVGAFPPGCLVSLQNEEQAIVVRRGATATTPVVYSLTSRGLRLGSPVRRETGNERYAVRSILPKGSVELEGRIESHWGTDLIHQRPDTMGR